MELLRGKGGGGKKGKKEREKSMEPGKEGLTNFIPAQWKGERRRKKRGGGGRGGKGKRRKTHGFAGEDLSPPFIL